MLSFLLNVTAYNVIAQEGAPSADSAQALAHAEKTGKRSHVMVTCAEAVASELREWFAVTVRLAVAQGDTDRADACGEAVEHIDAGIRRARHPRA